MALLSAHVSGVDTAWHDWRGVYGQPRTEHAASEALTLLQPNTPPLPTRTSSARGLSHSSLQRVPAAEATFDDLPLPLQDAILQRVVGEQHPLHTWSAGGAGARRSLRGVCRQWAARLAALCTTAHVSAYWLCAAADAIASQPSRFPRLASLHVFVPLLPAPHAVAAMRCLCAPHATWARCDVWLTLSFASSFDGVMLDDAVVSSLAASCPRLRQLRMLCSPGGRPLTAITAPALACRLLERLDLSGSAALSDAAASRIAARCPALRSLTLAGCIGLERPRLTGAQLEELDLSFCAGITDDAVEALVMHNPSLVRLSLVRCCACCACCQRIRGHDADARALPCAGDAPVLAGHRHASARAAHRVADAAAPRPARLRRRRGARRMDGAAARLPRAAHAARLPGGAAAPHQPTDVGRGHDT
jgi:hypothetical protein